MRRASRHSLRGAISRPAAAGLMLATILIGAAGTSCDSTAFREAAAQTVGDGVKGVFDGLVDGMVAGFWGIGADEGTSGSDTQPTSPSDQSASATP